MGAATAIALVSLLLGATVEVDVAPDQPLDFVYVDDPLILELRAEADTEATITISLRTSSLDEPYSTSLGPLLIHARGSRWCALKDLPAQRGCYTAEIEIQMGEESEQHSAKFCRVDRLAGAFPLPVYASTPGIQAQLALRAVAVPSLRLDVTEPDLLAQVEALQSAGFSVVAHLDAAQAEGLDVALVAGELAGLVSRWEIDPKGDPALLATLTETVRRAGSKAPILPVVRNRDELAAILAMKPPPASRQAVIRDSAPSEGVVAAYLRTAEAAGFEGFRLHCAGYGVAGGKENQGRALVQQVLLNLAAGLDETGFSPRLIYDDALTAGMAYANGLAHRLFTAEPAGRLDLGKGVTAVLFRHGAAWLLAIWCDGAAQEIALPLGDATEVTLTDAFNNPLPPVIEDGRCTLAVHADPHYLGGLGGSLPGAVAGAGAAQLAKDFSSNAKFRKYLPETVLDIVASTQQDGDASAQRGNFLNLLRVFPQLEEQWHRGELPKPVAVTAIAHLARLARALSTLEEDRGEAFLAPLADTLAHCEEYQSLYLTGLVDGAQGYARGDWLVTEVRRLMDEAEQLAEDGRRVEAGAVGALAEWRARSLEFAAQAGPLSERSEADFEPPPPPPEPELEPELEPEPEPELAPKEVEEAAPPSAPVIETITHTVASGDNASRIAKKYKVDVDDLLKWNGLKRSSVLNIGDKLTIRAEK